MGVPSTRCWVPSSSSSSGSPSGRCTSIRTTNGSSSDVPSSSRWFSIKRAPGSRRADWRQGEQSGVMSERSVRGCARARFARSALSDLAALVAAGCRQPASRRRRRRRPRPSRRTPRGAKPIRIAMIAKSSTNPVFLSARRGAETAARDLSAKIGVPIEIVWLTPPAGGRPDPGAADRAGGQRGGERRPHLLLGRRQADRRHRRRGRARRAGHDVRQRRAEVEALRLLRRRRLAASART